MTSSSADHHRPMAAALVRNISTTAWQTVGTVAFMIMIGLVGSVWLPWLSTMVNNAAV